MSPASSSPAAPALSARAGRALTAALFFAGALARSSSRLGHRPAEWIGLSLALTGLHVLGARR